MVLFFMVLVGIVLGQLHYWFIYKPIFKSYRIANLVLYVLTSFLIYDIVLAKYMFSEIEDKDSMAGAIWITSLLFSIIYDYKKSEEIRQAIEKERDRAQIEMLKTQINPHFLFNTLNNLYGTALVEESPKTATGILQLAQIMRHSVESSELEEIEIEKEIRFLQDYIELQKVRIPRRPNILIDTKLNWDETPARIAPLIVMTFVENAFKYGINPEQNCFIDLSLLVENKRLTLTCRNSIVTRIQVEKGTGMGLKNTIKRLQILYPDRHFLDINSDNGVYDVSLTLNLT
ncbi:sensor histidine kinase [Arundinibacter roseus]|nr:histidine kinase [Arundinibacter roseus]